MAKSVKIPPDIHFKNLATNEPTGEVLTFRQFVITSLLFHPIWSANLEGARAAADIVEAINQANGQVQFPESAYALLCKAINEPQSWRITTMTPQGPAIVQVGGGGLVQLLPFVDALLKPE